jgi:hypothetical protein
MLFGTYTYVILPVFPVFLVSYVFMTTYNFGIDTIKPYIIKYALSSMQTYTQCSLLIKRVCSSNPFFETAVNAMNHIFVVFHKTIFNYKIEPNTTLTGKKINVWINKIWYSNEFEETYDFIDDSAPIQDTTPMPYVVKYYDTVNDNRYMGHRNYLMIMKLYDTYKVHVNLSTKKTDSHEDKNAPFCTPSHVSFLTIQYIHPNQPQPVSIVLPKGMYTVGNQLFSSVFILRCLKYQTQPFYFDENYRLKIIDSDINMIELTNDQYIIIDKNTYTIHSFSHEIKNEDM